MSSESNPPAETGSRGHARVSGGPRETTRRSFLRDVGTKAAYVTPALLTLTASQVHAASSGCAPSGGACVVEGDCCTDFGGNDCSVNNTCCRRIVGSPCTHNSECCGPMKCNGGGGTTCQ